MVGEGVCGGPRGVRWAEEGEEFLVFGGCEGYAGVGGSGGGVDLGGQLAEAVLDPEVEDAGIPGLVEFVGSVFGCCFGVRGPDVPSVGGGDSGADAGVLELDDGVEEDEGGEEAGVEEGEHCSGWVRFGGVWGDRGSTYSCVPPKLWPTPTMG